MSRKITRSTTGSRKINQNRIFLVLEVSIVFILLFLNLAVVEVILGVGVNKGSHWAWTNFVGSDGASIVLSAISHNFGLGAPYKDYWGYYPPGFMMLIDFWVRIFELKIFSFKLLEILIRLGVGLEICLLARRIFPSFQALVVSLFTCFVFFSPIFGTLMLAEPYGLFFSLLGLLILLSVKNLEQKFIFSSAFFFLSGQMKDPFVFSVLSYVPLVFCPLFVRDYRSFFKSIFFILCGFSLVFFILWAYVTFLGSWDAYVATFLFKSSNFHARFWENLGFFVNRVFGAIKGVKDTFFYFQYSTFAILFFWFVFFVFSLIPRKSFLFPKKIKKETLVFTFPSVRFILTEERLKSIIVVFFSLGIFMGFSLNNGYTPRYLTMVIVPLYFFWSVIISSIASNLQILLKFKRKNLFFLLAVGVLLFPKPWIFSPYLDIPFGNALSQAYTNLILPDIDTPVEKYISSKISPSDCMVSLYGWKSPEPHLYSTRRPCSRFVQANMINADWQKAEYREAIFKNPPKAVVYSLTGADMDVLRFDREVINYTKIIKNCYIQDYKYTHNGRWPLELYFPIYSSEELKKCIKDNATI